jgi:hypothetical protein
MDKIREKGEEVGFEIECLDVWGSFESVGGVLCFECEWDDLSDKALRMRHGEKRLIF